MILVGFWCKFDNKAMPIQNVPVRPIACQLGSFLNIIMFWEECFSLAAFSRATHPNYCCTSLILQSYTSQGRNKLDERLSKNWRADSFHFRYIGSLWVLWIHVVDTETWVLAFSKRGENATEKCCFLSELSHGAFNLNREEGILKSLNAPNRPCFQ